MAEVPRHQRSRQPSQSSSVLPYNEGDVFGDEHEIEGSGTAEGFRPDFSLQDEPSSSGRESQSPASQNATSPAREKKTNPLVLNGTTQPLIARNSFSLRHDAQYSDAPRRIPSISSTIESVTPRPMSLLSRQSTYVRPQSTYNGPSAPSHPYGMYPQNQTELAHRTSVASTHRPTRETSFRGADRPTHPYAMYPQNVISAGGETDTLAGSADIASVGFPGLRQQYARRLGPDGEEADDIIGPDGHTEQLPPYTRYPDAAPVPAKSESTNDSATLLSAIPQEFSQTANSAMSMSDTLLSPSVDASRSATIIPMEEAPPRRTREKWSEKSKKKTCFGRLPMWAVALMIVLLVAAGAVLGGVIGRSLGHPKYQGPEDPKATSAPEYTGSAGSPTTTPDFGGAIPLPSTVTDVPPAPTGDFHLVVGSPSQSSNTCLTAEQQLAWDCMGGSILNFSVRNPWNSAALVALYADPTHKLFYGDQLPSIQGQVSGILSIDIDDSDPSPTLYFNSTYDKRVILHQAALSPGPSRRSLDRKAQLETRGLMVQDLELVWDCWWNQTNIDGFIYLDEPTRGDAPQTTTIDSAATSTSTGGAMRRGLPFRARKGSIPTNLYTRKVKMSEYRATSKIPAQCTLMQYCNGTLTLPIGTTVPEVINLSEHDVSVQKSAMFDPWAWRRSVQEVAERDRDSASGFCQCEWIIT